MSAATRTSPGRPISVGVFGDHRPWADLWFNQCDHPGGRHKDIVLRPADRGADHVVLIGTPHAYSIGSRAPGIARRIAKLRGAQDAAELEHALDVIGRDPRDVTMLSYEPRDAFSDAWFGVAGRRCARVYGPDDRATHPITLPVTWSMHHGIEDWKRAEPNHDRPISLACVTSGKTFWKGHRDRLGFIELLRNSGVEMELFGGSIDSVLSPRGPVQCKSNILRAARFTLAIENSADNDRYVTEKLWDPLLCWSLPIYYGSRAADALIPSEAFVRIPSLDARGVEVVRETIADPSIREARLSAIREAREKILGEHRLIEWMNRAALDAVGSGA